MTGALGTARKQRLIQIYRLDCFTEIHSRDTRVLYDLHLIFHLNLTRLKKTHVKKETSRQSATHPLKEKNNQYIQKLYPIFWIDWKSKIIGNAWSLESSVDKPPFKKWKSLKSNWVPFEMAKKIMIPLQLKKKHLRARFFWGPWKKYKAFFCVYLRNAEKKGTRMMGFL